MELTDRWIARLCFRILQHLPKKTKTTPPPKYSTPLTATVKCHYRGLLVRMNLARAEMPLFRHRSTGKTVSFQTSSDILTLRSPSQPLIWSFPAQSQPPSLDHSTPWSAPGRIEVDHLTHIYC